MWEASNSLALGLTVLSALLLILAYPPFDQGWLAWIALVPWIHLLSRSSGRQASLHSYLLGFLFFAGTIWWVVLVTVPGAILLVVVLALFFAGWGWWTHRALQRHCPLWALPAAWVLLEYLRSILFTGFGWNLLAYTQWNWLPVIQIAEATGAYGVSFLLVLVNFALWRGMNCRSFRPAVVPLLCLGMIWGIGRFLPPIPSLEQEIRIACLQGNIPQTQKWDEAFQEAIWKRYQQLLEKAVEAKPDLIVWPETAVPGFLEDPLIADRLTGLSRTAGTAMLVGAPTVDGEKIFNSAILLSSEGEEILRYDKVHLVPFGEFIPLKPVLGWLKKFYPVADFAPGKTFSLFNLEAKARNVTLPFSVLICFEDLFPGLCRNFVRRGTKVLLVITNDAWFGRSAASLQHLQASVFRAVENRVWVMRAANTGWTGFIDPQGRRLPPPGQIPRFKAGVAVADLQISPWPPTLYSRWGDWFVALCLILAIMGFSRWKRSSN